MKPNSQNNCSTAFFKVDDNSRYLTLVLLLLALLVNLTGKTSIAIAAESDFSQPIDVSADRSEYNEKTGKQSLSGNVEIRQGSILINADSIEVILKDNKLSVI